MSRIKSVGLLKISPEKYDGEAKQELVREDELEKHLKFGGVTHYAVVQSVCNPQPKGCFSEEFIPLTMHIQLRISVENSSGNKLIKNANNKRRQNSEHDIVQ